jgi:DNA-binding NarL/FixJ family response regulator
MESGVKKRILIVDSSDLFFEGLSRLINEQSDMECIAQVRHVTDLDDEDKRKMTSEVDLVIMDPKGNWKSVDYIESIRERAKYAAVVILSNYCGEDFVMNCISKGANGYLSKEISLSQLLATIRTLFQNRNIVPIHVDKGTLLEIAQSTRDAGGKRGGEVLGDREFQILKLLARGLNNKEIADLLYISHHTVGVHIASIFHKLKVNSRIKAVTWAISKGLIRAEDLKETEVEND